MSDEYIVGLYSVNGVITPLNIKNLDDQDAFSKVKKLLNGGRIELVGGERYGLDDYDLFVDEEGILRGLEPSPFFYGLYGNVILLHKEES